MHCLLTSRLATHGRAGTVLLDIAAAFDEVVQSVISSNTKIVSPDMHADVLNIFGCYNRMRSHVITAYGLSEWYCQLAGVMQGGGLDPPMYTTATIPLHCANMQQQKKGIPAMGNIDKFGPVGTLGLVDDTAVMGTGVEELQEALDAVRSVLGVLQQRTNRSKFKGIKLKVEDDKVKAFQPIELGRG